MKDSKGCGCGDSRKDDKKEKTAAKTVAKKNKELVDDANAIVERMESYTMKDRSEKKQEVKDAFEKADGKASKK